MNRNLVILFFTLVVIMLGFGMIIPILPFLVEKFGGGGLAMGALMAIFSLMQFLFSPLWGDLSDRIGRKPVLILGALGNGITMVGFALSTNLWMMYLFRALGGVLSSATLPTAMAFISDSTDEEKRGGGMGLVGAAMGVGMVLGPGIGGWMGGDSLQTPFFLSAGLSLLATVLLYAFLPESLPADQRLKAGLHIKGPQLFEMWRALSGPLAFLFILAFLHNFALTNFEGIFSFYAQERYDFDTATVGMALTVTGVVSAIVQGLLTGPATRRWGDALVVKASLLMSIFGFLVMLLARNLTEVLLTTGFFTFSNAMLRPGVASLISKRAQTSQGAAMGLANAFMSLGRIFGPLWAGEALDINLAFPFTTGAIIMAVAFAASLFYLRENKPARQVSIPAGGNLSTKRRR